MKKYLLPAILMLVVLSGLGWVTWWSLGTCRPLDRLLGLSGCTHTVELIDFAPLTHATMSSAGADGMVSLIGEVRTVDGYRPGLIRLDPMTGQEKGRYPLRIQNGLTSLVFSADGQRAAVGCSSRFDCLENDDAFAVIDVVNGDLIETLGPEHDLYPRTFPGEAEPGPEFHYSAQFTDSGQKVVTEDDDGRLVLQDLGGNLVAVLEPRHRSASSWLTVSPSSHYVALLRRPDDFSTIVSVWDGRDGRPVGSLQTGRNGSGSVAWSHDETAVFVVVREGRRSYLQRFIL
ncbi:MAG: hypothetical protein P0Y65_14595 [Candidatus Devosia phytovorans]|uniref:WD40 repeat domain-containing protein n=1 Tax=Candidatus Devosia phytovorans TaxID=3121372 RepID=A0AAJ5VRG0_9HYPH|nr:hypothetical protein [Devosia sp.]WEK03416.1 MAG: hypothetical protein P0Y65_14595 [Devosia sp.]